MFQSSSIERKLINILKIDLLAQSIIIYLIYFSFSERFFEQSTTPIKTSFKKSQVFSRWLLLHDYILHIFIRIYSRPSMVATYSYFFGKFIYCCGLSIEMIFYD